MQENPSPVKFALQVQLYSLFDPTFLVQTALESHGEGSQGSATAL